MDVHFTTHDQDVMVRRCVACGYDGSLLRNGRAARCARCGCDLRLRPARSYAEMEGLLGDLGPIPAPASEQRRQERLLHRWLAFLFFSMLAMMIMLTLASAAFSV